MKENGVEDIASPDPGGGEAAEWRAGTAAASTEDRGGDEPRTPPATCGAVRGAPRGGTLKAPPDPGGGGAAEWRTGSTGSTTARGGGTPTTPAEAVQPASLHLPSTDKEQAHLPKAERRMLEPSSLGEMTWKPPWSHGASVQQDPGAANKEEGDPGGGPGHQLTASMKAAFPAGRLTLSSPSQQEKQGGCNIWWLLSVLQGLTCPVLPGLRSEQQIPDYLTSMYARNSGKHQPFPPHPLGGGSAYITSTDLPRDHLSTTSPGERRYQPYQVSWRRES